MAQSAAALCWGDKEPGCSTGRNQLCMYVAFRPGAVEVRRATPSAAGQLLPRSHESTRGIRLVEVHSVRLVNVAPVGEQRRQVYDHRSRSSGNAGQRSGVRAMPPPTPLCGPHRTVLGDCRRPGREASGPQTRTSRSPPSRNRRPSSRIRPARHTVCRSPGKSQGPYHHTSPLAMSSRTDGSVLVCSNTRSGSATKARTRSRFAGVSLAGKRSGAK